MIQTEASRLGLLRLAGRRSSGTRRDPLEVLKTYFNRIRYVHVKDVRKDIFYEVQEKNLDFRQAVRKGVFTMPGDGDFDFFPIVIGLAASQYRAGSSLKRSRTRRSMILMIMLNVQKHIWAVCLFVNETHRGIFFTG
ncbi:hypothetical protein [Bacillus atrophaeus]|nr:hypothetical protein [Bacillus atrophaeus]MCY8512113.1 hypothetical protein [Bacillus atrophaeus]MCY8516072.1 hypothetical protein [Bacillus atrophaeus]